MGALLGLSVGSAFGSPLVIVNDYLFNAGFETPVTTCCSSPVPWSTAATAVGDTGNWNPSAFPSAGLTAYEGNQVGYVNNYSGQDGFNNWVALTQNVVIPGGLVEGTAYRLIYAVARRMDLDDPAGFRVQINGGGACPTCFAITSGSTGSIAAGTWGVYSVDYTAQAADAGQNLVVYLVNDGRIAGPGLAQVEFDVAAVPEPLTMALTGIGLLGLGLFRRKLTT